ncbi:RNA ligase RtcB family protein [Microbulbifer spongiae]|uniref:tRNA-splicing ligase RtcB n=1 Tax=Microbulbifer spongiae TaxID=2944933 RepID=A0ABY9EDS1_9GAMM|nr:RNA ligase RtcB family protein [Microbulbifer sp. MI-G]WKD50146.1 RNA ligase RtcB family protein [Microbulbifer sp. MI-G]
MHTFKENSASGSAVVKTLQASSQAVIRLVISDKNWLETSAVDQLKKTAELPGMRCVVGMPDLHPGKGQPIGAAFITHGHIYPHLVGSDIGCGMGLWKLNVSKRQVKLDKWEKRLVDLDDPWKEGDRDKWLMDAGVVTKDNALKSENLKLGTIGGGNHFAEIQQVNEIFDPVVLSGLGLDKHAVVFLAHSGSRGLGQKILRRYVDVHGGQSLISKADVNGAHSNGQRVISQYLQQQDYAIRWAVANRDLIAERFCQRLRVKKSALLDVSHNSVTALDRASLEALGLKHTDTERYWIHRKGASPTDQGLVMIPGSRGSLSYLVRPRISDIQSLAAGGFSLAHGAGRKWKRSECRGRLQGRYRVRDLEVTEMGSRVICQQRDLLYQEAPQAYKNISTVIDDLIQAGMMDVIASFKPIITYKTRRK